MARWFFVALSLWVMAFSAFASNGSNFQKRFQLVKNNDGKLVAIRLKAISGKFTIRPYLEQIKNDLIEEQRRWSSKNAGEMELSIDNELLAMGLDPYSKGDDAENIRSIKESLMNLPNVNVQESFNGMMAEGLMGEFESRMSDVLLQLDLALVANLEDSRFFYRRNVAYTVVTWALDQAKKRFSQVPLLNLASFVIVKVHDLLIEQKTFHHNMLLHYFQTTPESELGMTKEEVDHAISSIYEYRIAATGIQESNRAVREWDKYGWNNFYASLRYGNSRERSLGSNSSRYADGKRLNFGFTEFMVDGNRMILNLFSNEHMFSGKPAVAYDFAKPDRIKRNRALMNLAQVGLGFLPVVPGWIKGLVDNFIDSMHVEQRRLEGALVPYFETTGQADMVKAVYRQNINPYIVH